MLIDKLLGKQSVMISLDVDGFLFDRLNQITKSGFNLVEINSTDAKLFSSIKSQYPSLKIGAYGITDTAELEECYHAGVHFASSPGFLPSIAQTASVYSMNYFPGVATISEAMAAKSLGFHYVKPYPASLSFCTLLNKCMPKLRLLPNEVEFEEVEHFFNLPSVNTVVIHNPDMKQLISLINATQSIA
jgi:2-dehydro-3-deoxyphosphogluconate aldolase/(4S)-4-hydroxy-2-oxoglutarate aldolase